MYYNYCYKVNNFYEDPYSANNTLYQNLITAQQQPAEEVPSTVTPVFETGTLSLNVLSETGLPIEGALVTVYHYHLNGDLEVHYNLKTDKNGKIPDMELSVRYSEVLQNIRYYYSTYNLRVSADNYYPVNIVNFQVYPEIKSNFTIEMIPLTGNGSVNIPEKTIIIPPHPRN